MLFRQMVSHSVIVFLSIFSSGLMVINTRFVAMSHAKFPGGTEPAGALGQQELAEEIENSIGMKLRLIPAGSFNMGSEEGYIDEKPVHCVTISKPFYMGVYEVTQEQYKQIMDAKPSKFDGKNLPVENVSWFDAVEFCRRLSETEGLYYRLPTEAEWEYACRAGTTSKYYWGDKFDGAYSWYEKNSNGQTHPVGQKLPNNWGLYDMVGNVSEWCSDRYNRDYYQWSPTIDPQGPSLGQVRVLRGGSFKRWDGASASWFRDRHWPQPINPNIEPRDMDYDGTIGFRVVLDVSRDYREILLEEKKKLEKEIVKYLDEKKMIRSILGSLFSTRIRIL